MTLLGLISKKFEGGPLEDVVVDTTVDTTALANTKPRRKRKKRNKKKKPKQPASEQDATSPIASDENSSDEESVSFEISIPVPKEYLRGKSKVTTSNAPSGASNISTPQEVLRQKLIKMDGYGASQVEHAMEEMWEKGMAFDEYDAVVLYLQSCIVPCSTTTASMTSNLSFSTKNDEKEDDLATPSLNSESFEEGEAAAIMDDENLLRVLQDKEPEFQVQEEAKEPSTEPQAEPEPAPEAPPPSKMAMKLDTVANFENLTDAIFALTQWVRQAASDEEMEIFCRAEQTSALPTIIRRGISSEIEDTSRFETAVRPSLVRFLMSVLHRCGVDELGGYFEAELQEKIEEMLKQARKVCGVSAPNVDDDESVIADRVARFVVSRLEVAMDEMRDYHLKRNENNESMDQTDYGEELAGEETDVAMAALLSQRDALKATASRASSVVGASMKSMFGDFSYANGHANGHANGYANGHANGHANGYANGHASPSLESQDIRLHIVDQPTRDRFFSVTSRLEKLKSQVQEEGESTDPALKLRESVAALQTKRQGYQKKIAELRAALQELEAQDAAAALEMQDLSTQIVNQAQNDVVDAKQLEQEISDSEEFIQYGNLVSGLAETMKSYGKTIETATASMTGKKIRNNANATPIDDEPSPEATSRAMQDYLVTMRDYFLKEAHCATKLRSRLATKKAETTALQSELKQYESLKGKFAMSTIKGQLKKTIAQNKRTIRADTHRIHAIAETGICMYDELLCRIQTYKANNEDFFPTELLKGVPAAIRALAIVDDCEELAPFVQEPAPKEREEASTPTPAAAKPVHMAPKLTWASSGAKQQTAFESLLDIQKQERRRQISERRLL